ncbi:hypothetical protein C2G38_2207601 [Gigaspora rosea]|uniref:Peptidase A2 domain-containing protein n=1 Tax=Gigaspora rosea TaxID=44941 RepID=A0A397URT1_9GLOM|nr:hypothetical protein C2G38_2207601 [Gigaspora rosea]
MVKYNHSLNNMNNINKVINENLNNVEDENNNSKNLPIALRKTCQNFKKIFIYKIINKQSPPETLQSLLKYEYKAGLAQKFLDRVGINFRWPSSMPEYFRRDAFIKIVDIDLEEDEVGFNMVIEYGDEYNNDELNSVFNIMPNAIQLPVDAARLPCSKPAKMVIAQRSNNGSDYKVKIRIRRPNDNNKIVTFSYDFYDALNHNKKYTCVVDTGAPNTILSHHARRILGRKGWSRTVMIAGGYSAPTRQICASMMFEVSIGDNLNWTKWIQAKIIH